jgi:beta-glucosidase
MGVEIAKEARWKAGNVLLAPTLNVMRSPLGGRNYETYSEDPFVLGSLAAAFVNGCQSQGIAATPKHFVANEAENERKRLSVEVDEQTLREIYLLPFQLVMKLSKPLCFMTSYNRVNGTYVCDDRRLVDSVLRQEWGFDGLVMSDWMGTYSTAESINAGVDLEMPGPTKWRGDLLQQAIITNKVSETTVNDSVKRVLQLAKVLGRFEDPSEPLERVVEDPRRDDIIAHAAAEGIVLLKNEGILPICRTKTVGMIGQHAYLASIGGGGSAMVDAIHSVSPITGLAQLGVKVKASPGVPVYGALPHADPQVVFPAGDSNRVVDPVKIEWFNSNVIGQNKVLVEWRPTAEYMIKEKWPGYLDREYCSRITLDLQPKTTGSHDLSVISTGAAKLYINGEIVYVREQETDLVLEAFYFYKKKLERRLTYYMHSEKTYTIVLESWATDPEVLNESPLFGKLYQGSSLRFQEHINLIERLEDAATVAKDVDYAIVCVGNTNDIESEGYDRETMHLTQPQYDLIDSVVKANSNTIVVNFSGGATSMVDFVDKVPAIVHASFPGQGCGHSLAQILTGQVNPSGRLPFSWPRELEDNSSFGNFPVGKDLLLHYKEGLDIGYRHYDRHDSPDPLFPFGFGLSYTTFEISNLHLSSDNLPADPMGTIDVACDVTNTGLHRGKCVVQIYVAFPSTTVGRPRPVKELKAFKKVDLEPSSCKTMSVTLDKYSISVYDAKKSCWMGVKGTFAVLVGFSSVDIVAESTFTVGHDFFWRGV